MIIIYNFKLGLRISFKPLFETIASKVLKGLLFELFPKCYSKLLLVSLWGYLHDFLIADAMFVTNQ